MCLHGIYVVLRNMPHMYFESDTTQKKRGLDLGISNGGLLIFRSFRLQDFNVSRLQDFKIAKTSGFKDCKDGKVCKDFRISELQDFKDYKIFKFLITFRI